MNNHYLKRATFQTGFRRCRQSDRSRNNSTKQIISTPLSSKTKLHGDVTGAHIQKGKTPKQEHAFSPPLAKLKGGGKSLIHGGKPPERNRKLPNRSETQEEGLRHRGASCLHTDNGGRLHHNCPHRRNVLEGQGLAAEG